ncbi:MAG TPA: MFS transporter [Chloroflexota bacterium]|nr:MFS transporter [Chloroflexota bacterium]
MRAPRESRSGLRLLQLAAFFSSFDRFAVAPMLVTIAAALGASLAETTATASLYYLLYGGMQPMWGILSDRLGRVRVIRLTLLGAAVAGVLSAAAPNLAVLIAARALAGGLFAAVIPASLVYIGDTVGMDSRQKALADLMAASAVGTALATVFGGLAAYLGAWRLAFAAPALAGVALAVLLTRLPEPKGFAAGNRVGPLVQVGRVLRRPWAMVVIGIVLVEGAVILGCLTFLAPSLESVGFSPAVAGLAVGLYGLAVLGWTRAVKLLANRLGASALILIGAGMLALGYASGAVAQSLVSVSAAAVFVGGGFAFMHSTLQTWATEVVPEARATVISLFAAALFAGSGVAAMAAAPLAEAGSFDLLFGLATVVAVPLGLFAALARYRYVRHRP